MYKKRAINLLSPGRTQLSKRCPECGQVKSKDEFGLRLNGYFRALCKPCLAVQRRLIRRQNPERTKAAQQRASIYVAHGIRQGDYFVLLARQNGKCAICNRAPDPTAPKKRLAIDHCHQSRRIRGLLCSNCNVGLGAFHDDANRLRKAATYLETATTEFAHSPRRGLRSTDCAHTKRVAQYREETAAQ